MRTNYVLIDHENVQTSILPMLKHLNCKVIMFVGANQTKLPFETVAALQQLGSDASYVKIAGNGPNALDLHIAFYIGQLSQQEPNSFFHIISKDKGFDPLLEHLKSKKVFAMRSCSVAEIPLLRAISCSTPADRCATIIARLHGMGSAKPTRVKTLIRTVHAIFLRQLSEVEVVALVNGLVEAGFITIEEAKVMYSLPTISTLNL